MKNSSTGSPCHPRNSLEIIAELCYSLIIGWHWLNIFGRKIMLAIRTLDGLIVKDPQIHSGRPVVAGTGNTVRAIAIMYEEGYSPEEIGSELPLTLAQIYAALTYYHLHVGEIETDILTDAEEQLK